MTDENIAAPVYAIDLVLLYFMKRLIVPVKRIVFVQFC